MPRTSESFNPLQQVVRIERAIALLGASSAPLTESQQAMLSKLHRQRSSLLGLPSDPVPHDDDRAFGFML